MNILKFIITIFWIKLVNCEENDSRNSASSLNQQKCDEFCPEKYYGAHSPYVPCENLPLEFLECEEPLDHKGNDSARIEIGHGCSKFGGQKYDDVQFTSRNCTVLDTIQCYGERNFMKGNFPCIKFTGHYFVTTLIYSILLGFLGIDRFILGHTGTAVGKLLTLGGVGIWWIVDIVLIVTGHLMPEDGSNWMPYA